MLTSEISQLLNAELVGDLNLNISYINKIEFAIEGEISFIANPLYEKYEETTNASALIVSKEFKLNRDDICYLITEDPYMSFLKILNKFNEENDRMNFGIHHTACIEKSSKINSNTVIGSNVYIGNNCIVGENTVLHPNVVLYDNTIIGDNCIIHAGSVIGSDGFGYVPSENGEWIKIPHIGNVVIEDNVEIGANTTIDRGTIGETRICKGVKIDNLVQIAHNVRINENTVIAGQSAIAGSAVLGKNNILAGQVGIVGHIKTVDNVTILGRSGVSKDITHKGKYYGSPAREYITALKEEAALRQLPKALIEIERLKLEIEKFVNINNEKNI